MDPGFVEAFLKTIGWYVMGSRTYETALRFEAQGYGWSYGDKPVFVLTSRDLSRTRDTVEFYSGDTAGAIDDLRKAVELEPSDSYSAIWLEIASRRSGKAGALAQSIPNLDMSEWPAPLVELMVDRTTPEAVVGAARSSIPRFDRVRRCEANFYGGEWLLLNGSETEAAKLLRYAFDNCPHNFSLEWVPARLELKLLEGNTRR